MWDTAARLFETGRNAHHQIETFANGKADGQKRSVRERPILVI